MVCTVITPKILEIAKVLGMPIVRVQTLAGMYADKYRSDLYTALDILTFYETEIKTNKTFYKPDSAIQIKPKLPSNPLVDFDNKTIYLPQSNEDVYILSYFIDAPSGSALNEAMWRSKEGKSQEAFNKKKSLLKSILTNRENSIRFLKYYLSAHRVHECVNSDVTSKEGKIQLEVDALNDAYDLFRGYVELALGVKQSQQMVQQSQPQVETDTLKEGESLFGELKGSEKEEGTLFSEIRSPEKPIAATPSKLIEQQVQPAQTVRIPQAPRNVFISNENNDPLRVLIQSFNSIERADAEDSIAQAFSIQVNILMRMEYLKAQQAGDTERMALFANMSEKDRKNFIISNFKTIFNAVKEDLINYLANPNKRQLDLNKFGEEYVNNKIFNAHRILDNWELLCKGAAIGIERVEQVAIDITNNIAKEQEESQDIIDPSDNDREDPEAETKDGWMFRAREVDPRLTISSRVKRVLADTPRGDGSRDMFGNLKRISFDFAHAVLINELSKMSSVEDFVKVDADKNIIELPALEKLTVKYSWINSIIRKLKADKTGALASQFFTDFRKDFIANISVIETQEEVTAKNPDGSAQVNNITGEEVTETVIKKITKNLNETISVDATISEVINNYDNDEHLVEDTIYSHGKVDKTSKDRQATNLHNIIKTIQDSDFEWSEKDIVIDNVLTPLTDILKSIGFNIKVEDLISLYDDPNKIEEYDVIIKNLNIILTGQINDGDHLINFFQNAYTEIAEIVGRVSETMNIQSFKAGDKMFYSYSTPSYTTTMVKKLTNVDDITRQAYIDEQFKKYEWFYNHANGTWRNYWLELLESNKDVREHFKVEDMNTITTISGVKAYTEWSEADILTSFLMQYYSIPKNSKSTTQYAKYNMPIFSDSPVVSFMTMPKFVGENYKEDILDRMVEVVKQEILRIKEIRDRKAQGFEEIANFESKGNKFLFFPELNDQGKEGGASFYDIVDSLLNEGNIEDANNYIKSALRAIQTNAYKEYSDKILNLEDSVKEQLIRDLISSGVISSRTEFENALEEYFWNQSYATTQIIQLTTTDLAFYKHLIDFQKRFKEVYASGNKLNTNSKHGRKKEKVVYLKDIKIPSNVLTDISSVVEQAYKEGRISKMDADAIKYSFKEVNGTDAQAYRTIYSMRAILDMMGQWTPEMERAINKFKEGTWTTEDYTLVWQTIKPFMFTQSEVQSANGPIKVPAQHKNSEFLLLAMHDLIASSNIGKSPILKALNEWMVDNDIDVVMFESAVKAGNQTTAELNKDMTGVELKSALDAKKSSPTFIKEFDYEDYVIQTPTPEHLINHLSIFGSQFRNLIISDISDNAVFTIAGKSYNKQELLALYQGAIVENLLESYKEVKEKFATIEDLQKALIQSVSSSNKYGQDIIDALQIIDDGGQKRFNIPLYNPSTTEKLQEVINSFFKSIITKQHIKGGNAILVSSFGFTDELKCIYETDESGKKHLSKVECYLPASAKEFYKAFVKTDTKGNEYLKIEDVPEELKYIIGYRIPTEDKYSMVPLYIKGFLPQANGSAIMLPADITVHAGLDYDVDKEFLMIPEFIVQKYNYDRAFKDYVKAKKTILDSEALWNDIYENVPGVKDAALAAREADYKRWLKEGNKGDIEAYKKATGNTRLYKFLENHQEVVDAFLEKFNDLDYTLQEGVTSPFKEWFKENKSKYLLDRPIIKKVEYDFSKEVKNNSRAARNNLLIDISRAILTHPDTVDKFVNPGSFDKLKVAANIALIADNKELWKALKEKTGIKEDEALIEALLNHKVSQDTLSDIATSKELNPLSPLTFAYFHKQNMTGGALIGMYANNTTLFSKFQSKDQSKTQMCLTYEIVLDGKIFKSLDKIISPHGERVSRNCAEFSAASVDNVKDPVLAKLMQSTDTANMTSLMLRLGMTIDEIGLIFTQPAVKYAIEHKVKDENHADSREKIDFTSVLNLLYLKNNQELNIWIDRFFDGKSVSIKEVNKEGLNTIDLLKSKVGLQDDRFISLLNKQPNLEDGDEAEVYYSDFDLKLLKKQVVLLALMAKIDKSSKDLKTITKVSRADSPNGAIANTIAGNIIQRQRVRNLHKRINSDSFTIQGASIYNDRITSDMSEDTLRNLFMSSRFPMLQAFYSLGIDFAHELMKDSSGRNYFIQYDDNVIDAVDWIHSLITTDTLDERSLNDFFKDFIKYALSDIKMFGGKDFNKQRDFYLTQYPSRFMQLKATHPELGNLGIFRKITLNEKTNQLQFEKSGRLTVAMKEAFMRDLDGLLLGDELAKQTAIDLFVYSYYKDGLYFGPNSFGNFFSTRFLTSMPQFINALRNLSTTDAKNFAQQWLLYNYKKLKFMRYYDNSARKDRKKIRVNDVTDPVTKEHTINCLTSYFIGEDETALEYMYVTLNGDDFLCERVGDGTGEWTTYRLLHVGRKKLGNQFVSPRYNKQMSLKELASYSVGKETLSDYAHISEATPVDSILDIEVKSEEVSLDKQEEELEKYSRETNNNLKEPRC